MRHCGECRLQTCCLLHFSECFRSAVLVNEYFLLFWGNISCSVPSLNFMISNVEPLKLFNNLCFRIELLDAVEKLYTQSMNTKVSPESKAPWVVIECIEFPSASQFNYLAWPTGWDDTLEHRNALCRQNLCWSSPKSSFQRGDEFEQAATFMARFGAIIRHENAATNRLCNFFAWWVV